MLGSAMRKVLQASKFEVHTSFRGDAFSCESDALKSFYFDVKKSDLREISKRLSPGDYVLNCIGVVKSQIKEADIESRDNTLLANAVFPHRLAAVSEKRGFRVIQIATDCVYSGAKGNYSETDGFDPSDLYGMSKRLGEVPSQNFMHLRASIIGREKSTNRSLVEWVLGLDRNSRAYGFTDHIWNGVTAVAFARVCRGIIEFDGFRAGTQHLVPADKATKNELVKLIAKKFDREDILFSPMETGTKVDRSLSTIDTQKNLELWSYAGFPETPRISDMISEL